MEEAEGDRAVAEDAPALICVAADGLEASDFSRRFGVPPSAFDVARFRETRRSELVEAHGDARLARLPPGRNPDGFIATLRRLPPRRVA